MKRCICALLCLLLLGSLALPVTAATLDPNTGSGSVIITAQVPYEHTITVVTDGGAEVLLGDNAADRFTVDRLSSPELIIRGQKNHVIKSAFLNGEDITAAIDNGFYLFSPVFEDKTLTLITEKSTPPDNLRFTVKGTVTQNGKPVKDVELELRSEPKTDTTDRNGAFRFEDVESGHHSLTALLGGKIVGYMEFELVSGAAEVNFSIADGGVTEIKIPDDTATIDLILKLSDDEDNREISIADVKTQQTRPDPDAPPPTGSSGGLQLWLALLGISTGVLAVTGVAEKKRKKQQ
ncbi:MAG: carboxypeptidase regulatory-like domain-containing protein [Clostridiales bacterium]|nr:carboxypeptidase regulatory-like domain-containing protein [Clostridiales bacterium]